MALPALTSALAPSAAGAADVRAYTGVVQSTHGDVLGERPTRERLVLRTSEGTLRLRDPALRAYAGSRVRVLAERDGGTLTDARVTARDHEEQPYPPAVGPRRVAVLLASTAADAGRRWDAARVEELVFGPGLSVAEHMAAQSRGRSSLEGDVLGWYDIDAYPAEGCGEWEIGQKARDAARASGVDLSGYHYVMTMFPRRTECSWNGMAEVGWAYSWINGLPPDFRLLAHELGHNYRLYHAKALRCAADGAPTTMTGACTIDEYGDPLDVMGHGQRHLFTGFHRANIGWIRPEEVIDATAEGLYALTSVNDDATGPKLLQVRREPADQHDYLRTQHFFTVELRTPRPPFDDFALGDSAVSGITIRRTVDVRWMWPGLLLDMTPGSPGGHRDGALTVGRSFTEPASGVRFTLESLASGVGAVRVAYPPTAPRGVRAALDGVDAATLSWEAATDAKGISGYEVERDGVVVARTSAMEARDTGLPRGRDVGYRVVAVDTDGNRTASEPVTVTTAPLPPSSSTSAPGDPDVAAGSPDRTRPRLRLRPRVGRRLPRSRRLVLTGTDDRGGLLRITASLDGRRLRTARARRVTVVLPRRALRRRHALVLTVTDGAGNRRVIRLRIVRGILRRG